MKLKNRLSRSRSGTRLLCLITSLLALPLVATFGEEAEEIREKNLIVNIDDPHSLFDIDAEWIREDLLYNAFYDAARREKLGDFDITYNAISPKNARGVLEFDVIS